VALSSTRHAYAGMADAWAADAALAYGPLARHLVARAPGPMLGAVALDAGAGSGLAGDALRALGARVVAADQEFDMARYGAQSGPAVTADVTALPFRADVFDVVVAAFVVNHLPDPVAGLRELRRVARPGGTVLASTFSTERATAKAAVDEVAAEFGFVQPPWYAEVRRSQLAVGDVTSLERALAAAGFASATVTKECVDVGLAAPEDVVRYRLGMPHLRGFAASLSDEVRTRFVEESVAAVRRVGERFMPSILEVVARVGG
jgi:ubiquinone/menaquinone biosynthesis C-methylase UbiE